MIDVTMTLSAEDDPPNPGLKDVDPSPGLKDEEEDPSPGLSEGLLPPPNPIGLRDEEDEDPSPGLNEDDPVPGLRDAVRFFSRRSMMTSKESRDSRRMHWRTNPLPVSTFL